MNVASLCAGIGGADLALESHGHRIAWHAEVDPNPSKVLTHHWPDVPNVGDITNADWSTCEPVDLISAGYPCQGFSLAGLRKGTDDVRHLWPHVRDAIVALRPRYAFLENVVGHFSLGAAVVVHDLAQIGYVSTWGSLGSSAVGGCHRRERFWLLAADASCTGRSRGEESDILTPARLEASRGHDADRCDVGDVRPSGVDLLPTPTAWLGRRPSHGDVSAERWLDTERSRELSDCIAHLMTTTVDFGHYQPAVDRWARIFGPPPAPTDHKGRLNPPFVEWMLGFPAGWVTDLDLSRSAQLKALGNAQQPQTAAAAFGILAARLTAELAQEAA